MYTSMLKKLVYYKLNFCCYKLSLNFYLTQNKFPLKILDTCYTCVGMKIPVNITDASRQRPNWGCHFKNRINFVICKAYMNSYIRIFFLLSPPYWFSISILMRIVTHPIYLADCTIQVLQHSGVSFVQTLHWMERFIKR